jgi:hypothetical protein
LLLVSSIAPDRADAPAADLDVVVLDELAGVLEDQLVLMAAVAFEQQPRDKDHHQSERREGSPAGHGHPAASCDKPLLIGSGTLVDPAAHPIVAPRGACAELRQR